MFIYSSELDKFYAQNIYKRPLEKHKKQFKIMDKI